MQRLQPISKVGRVDFSPKRAGPNATGRSTCSPSRPVHHVVLIFRITKYKGASHYSSTQKRPAIMSTKQGVDAETQAYRNTMEGMFSSKGVDELAPRPKFDYRGIKLEEGEIHVLMRRVTEALIVIEDKTGRFRYSRVFPSSPVSASALGDTVSLCQCRTGGSLTLSLGTFGSGLKL